MIKQSNSSQGFTLIELVVVIIVLGILAVVAAAKYVDLKRDSEIARVQATAAALQQSVTFSHTKWQLIGANTAMNDLPDYVGGVLDINSYGFPLGTGKGNPMGQPKNIGQGEQGCVDLWNILQQDPASIALSSVNDDSDFQAYRHQADTNPDGLTECTYVLRTLGDTQGREQADMKIVYDSVAGTVKSFIKS
ncbi:prepilin-type N-terminal cleavage/methylation domain-containing protein [Shewanella sp. 1CM18E]|uniref:type II secretion system protein n=1 Tax=Shewanella sp. 1CM18E TaxID=2929169 RepID=UPI0020BE1C0E|nr:prepilin-type N-terminal cleavage/methylation domain-containing protein [Shewanella sp. 1CM18E]MCK8045359.1 prepilin-type N-terminal cleavage/methylation domain-containing protein [Shewanella sp. 1CM18E]